MVTAEEQASHLRDEIDAAIDADDGPSARALVERLWALRPGPANAGFIIQHRDALARSRPLREITVHICRSFTVEPLVPVLRAAGLVHGLDITVEVGGFNTYAQELLDPSSNIYAAPLPDVVVLDVQSRDLAPDLWSNYSQMDASDVDGAAERVVAEIDTLVTSFRRLSTLPLIIHELESPPVPALGIVDGSLPAGQRATFARINARLREIAAAAGGVLLIDVDRIIARVGLDHWHDDRKWLSMKMPLRSEAMSAVADEWLRVVMPLVGEVAKVLVVDLDNTLWGGVVGEVGRDGVVLDAERSPGAGHLALQHTLLDLRARGILLAICSKNNLDDALDVLDNHPAMVVRSSHFSAMRVDWNQKPDNLRSIAAELNVGVDSFAFIDDNPAECDQMRRALPEVTVIELDRSPTPSSNPLQRHPRLERTSLSSEDLNRAEMYRQQHERRDLEQSASSLDEYLHSLQTSVRVTRASDADVARVAQLTQKTNQFNLTTQRYSEPQIERFRLADDVDVFAVRATDRFGDHGLIGTAIVRHADDVASIDTLLLSCRVIGRGVETAMLSHVAAEQVTAGRSKIVGTYAPTSKNAPAADFYADNDFLLVADNNEESTWTLDLTGHTPSVPPWITVNDDETKEDEHQ